MYGSDRILVRIYGCRADTAQYPKASQFFFWLWHAASAQQQIFFFFLKGCLKRLAAGLSQPDSQSKKFFFLKKNSKAVGRAYGKKKKGW